MFAELYLQTHNTAGAGPIQPRSLKWSFEKSHSSPVSTAVIPSDTCLILDTDTYLIPTDI